MFRARLRNAWQKKWFSAISTRNNRFLMGTSAAAGGLIGSSYFFQQSASLTQSSVDQGTDNKELTQAKKENCVNVYLWFPHKGFWRKHPYLAIQTPLYYVGFRPYDTHKKEGGNPFLYTFDEDKKLECREPDHTFSFSSLDIAKLEQSLLYFASSEFGDTGIFDPEQQTVFWEKVLRLKAGKDFVAISKIQDLSKYLEPVPILGDLIGLPEKTVNQVVGHNKENLERQAVYNWFNIVLTLLMEAGLFKLVKPLTFSYPFGPLGEIALGIQAWMLFDPVTANVVFATANIIDNYQENSVLEINEDKFRDILEEAESEEKKQRPPTSTSSLTQLGMFKTSTSQEKADPNTPQPSNEVKLEPQ